MEEELFSVQNSSHTIAEDSLNYLWKIPCWWYSINDLIFHTTELTYSVLKTHRTDILVAGEGGKITILLPAVREGNPPFSYSTTTTLPYSYRQHACITTLLTVLTVFIKSHQWFPHWLYPWVSLGPAKSAGRIPISFSRLICCAVLMMFHHINKSCILCSVLTH